MTGRLQRYLGPLSTIIVLLVAAASRLLGLGYPHELVFDETYYVKDAYTLLNLGYEGSWPANPNVAFDAGMTEGWLASPPSFIAHPPVGKWIIALGLSVFGAGSSFGWRIAVAICGILLVAVVMLLAHHLFRSRVLTAIAGGLIAIDGNAIVMSRVSLLDTILALFAATGAYFVLRDRTAVRERIDDWAAAATSEQRAGWGPVLWRRPWLIAASVAFGLAAGVKWSGLYFLAIFAVYALVSEIIMRRQARIDGEAGIAGWWQGGLRQAPVTFLLTVPLALGVYVAGWTGWFVTQGGYYRQWVQLGGEAWTGALGWVPVTFQNWWHYQAAMYAYHVGESTPHNYQASPLGWLLMIRPTSMFYREYSDATAETILGLANPLIWWAGAAALVYLVYRVVRRLIRRQAVGVEVFILTGIAAGYLPWLLYLNRTVFTFYTIAFEPFLILALTAAIGVLLGRRDLDGRDHVEADGFPERSVVGTRVVVVFLVACVVLSIYFLPMWTAMNVPTWYLKSHWWFPSWI